MNFPQSLIKQTILIYLLVFPILSAAQIPMRTELIGEVRDDRGNVVQGASVYNVSKGKILSTGLNGNFRVSVTAGDTITVHSSNFKSTRFVVPKIKDPYLFQNFTITFDVDQALAAYTNQKLSQPNKDSLDESGLHTITLAGRVLSANGDALVDANVAVGNSMEGTITNSNGVYRIQVAPGDSVYFSYMGHRSQTVYVENIGNEVVMKDVMLVPTAFMLQGVKVSADKAILNLDYSKVGMDAGEASRYEIRNRALRTDKTYFPMVGVSTASFGGLSEIFKSKKKRPSQKVLQRQILMRNKVLEGEEVNDSSEVAPDNL